MRNLGACPQCAPGPKLNQFWSGIRSGGEATLKLIAFSGFCVPSTSLTRSSASPGFAYSACSLKSSYWPNELWMTVHQRRPICRHTSPMSLTYYPSRDCGRLPATNLQYRRSTSLHRRQTGFSSFRHQLLEQSSTANCLLNSPSRCSDGVMENTGLENDGLKNRAGKCNTGIWRTEEQGWKMQD